MSDAMHTKGAVMREWDQITRTRLLDPSAFAVVWDDCSRGIRAAYRAISAQVQAEASGRGVRVCSGVFAVHGWLGVHEARHDACVLTTLDLERARATDALFGSFKVREPVRCA
jgi:hypothetical protein